MAYMQRVWHVQKNTGACVPAVSRMTVCGFGRAGRVCVVSALGRPLATLFVIEEEQKRSNRNCMAFTKQGVLPEVSTEDGLYG